MSENWEEQASNGRRGKGEGFMDGLSVRWGVFVKDGDAVSRCQIECYSVRLQDTTAGLKVD